MIAAAPRGSPLLILLRLLASQLLSSNGAPSMARRLERQVNHGAHRGLCHIRKVSLPKPCTDLGPYLPDWPPFIRSPAALRRLPGIRPRMEHGT